MHAAACILDPEYLLRHESTQFVCLTFVGRLCLIKDSPSPELEVRKLTTEPPAVVARITRCHQQYARARAQDGILGKPYVVQNAMEMIPSE